MASVNRYYEPSDYQYVSQYVPIPFDQLYQVGREYNNRVDQAQQEFSNNLSKWREFQSPSAIDMQRYNELTIEPAKEIAMKFAQNPDLLKTATGRQEMQAFINSRPYAELAKLQQSRDAMVQRQKLNQQLLLNGRYNPEWHDVDFSNYDTLGNNKVFDDLNPVPYMSAAELSKQYFDNLKPGALDPVYRNGIRYNRVGNTEGDLRAVAEAHQSDLINTPQGQMYYKQMLQRAGGDPALAQQMFKDMIVAANIDKTLRPTETVDPYSLQMAVLNAKARMTGAGADSQTQSYLTDYEKFTNSVNKDFNRYARKNIQDPTRADYKEDQTKALQYTSLATQAMEEYQNAINGGASPEQLQQLSSIIDKASQQARQHQATVNRKEFANMYGSSIKPEDFNNFKGKVDAQKFNKVSQDLIDNMSGSGYDTNSKSDAAITKYLTGARTEVTSPLGKREAVVKNGADVLLPQQLAASLLNMQGKIPGADNELIKTITSGAKDLSIIPSGRVLSVADPYAPGNTRLYMKGTAVVPDVDEESWFTTLTYPLMWIPKGAERIFNGTDVEQAVKALNGEYDSDTKQMRFEVYVPLSNDDYTVDNVSLGVNKGYFGTSVNAGDRTDMTIRTFTRQ